MIHLGDITKIHGGTAPIVDCIIGGSPCQDLSIAGKRAGLTGERSGLYMEQIRVIKEMRENDRANGRTGEFIRPRYMVWENVPGAFSSNHGKDFAAVLEEAVKIIDPKAPPVPVPEKGWPTSGCLMGDGWSVAWRVLNAQFWGVPQRRRRIVLVADFGGQSAPEILFVRKSVSGDSQPGSEKRKGFAGSSAQGVSCTVRIRGGCDGGGKGPLVQTEASGTLGCNNDQTLFTSLFAGFSAKAGSKAGGIGFEQELGPTLSATRHDASVFCKTSRPQNAQDGCKFEERSIAITMTRHDTGESRASELIVQPIAFRENSFGDFREDTCGSTCKQRDCKGTTDIIVAVVDCRNGTENPTTNGTLQAKPTGGSSLNLQNVCRVNQTVRHVCRVNQTVRRLTPMECERLQGFPDGWTDIGPWTDSKGKLHKESSDSARYKALGNSIALPPWKWVLKRLCAQYERDATMASLFDGIGGFPLLWEQLNGKGSCLWASEIEEFPMAVTRKRFG